jgi:methionine biosynthesis protein MetW
MNQNSGSKLEHVVIAQWIDSGASVLDLGCGNGELLTYLTNQRKVHGQGIELSEQSIARCVAEGLSVYQQDLDIGLSEYADNSFDFVILNQTLQQVKKPDLVLTEAFRVGKKTIVGIPNFAFYKSRFHIFFKGRVPVTAALPFQWYDTPNLHFLSFADFQNYCKTRLVQIKDVFYTSNHRQVRFLPNLLAEYGFFLLTKTRA